MTALKGHFTGFLPDHPPENLPARLLSAYKLMCTHAKKIKGAKRRRCLTPSFKSSSATCHVPSR